MLHLIIIPPEQTVYDSNVESVTLPTSDGEITVLPQHIPLITTIVPGAVIVREGGKESVFAVSRGVIEVGQTDVRVLSDIADRADVLEEEAVEKAKLKAEQLLSEKREDAESFAEASIILERELARVKAVRRHRSRRSFSTPPTP